MFILISHFLGFLGLSAAAIYDLKTTEVPDYLSLFVIAAGIMFHGLASIQKGSINPIMWSLGAGLIFGVYGWGMYYLGMWGGADAFIMNALGFAAPFSLSGAPSIIYSIDLFVNIMLAGFVYTLVFSIYKAAKNINIVKNTIDKLAKSWKRVVAEILAALIISLLISNNTNLRGSVYFGLMIGLIVLFRFLRVIESSEMKTSIPISELEPGDVVQTDEIEMENVRHENFIGSIITKMEKHINSGFLESLRKKYGYSEIVGITQDEIVKLKEQDIESVKVKEGVRFVPVFPIALLVTDTVGLGVFFVSTFIN